jgi:hypothetical protein
MIDQEGLNAPRVEDRLDALRAIAARRRKSAAVSRQSQEVNCHVHTFYSFSPYSPSAAAERAQSAGLAAVGIIDHDSMAGAAEMRAAGSILGIATTAGVELRVSAAGTALEGRRINNPDSLGILYIIIHGVPARSVAAVQDFLRPLQAAREGRGRRMLAELNALLPSYGLHSLDWERDVRAISRADEGGSITERHILFALANAVVEKAGTGKGLVDYLLGTLGMAPGGRVASYLADPGNDFLHYDLLGLLKGSFLEKVFIQPDEKECIHVSRAVRLAEETGGIPTYPYLGDVRDSPTGDKKAESYEDSYLEELMEEAGRLGFRAIAYMPPRNTLSQLRRVQELCSKHGFMEISGVDVNSPRQSFNCPELLLPEFSHLSAATWALIAHERLADADARYALFRSDNPLAHLPLQQRIHAYAEVGMALDPSDLAPANRHPLVAAWARGR